jgi:protocatechuate 3,4-dioxygenase beta subunit
MHLIATPAMGRRRLVVSGLAAAGALMLPPRLAAQQAGLVATPPTTAGPFYPVKFPPDVDNDLVVLRGNAARAEGAVTHVAGRVLGLDGKPIAGATVEIWQCDARGRYIHPGDVGGRPRDKAFQGYGRTVSGADGGYRFRTIKPVPYPRPHAAYPFRRPGAGQARARHPNVCRGRAGKQPRRALPLDPRPAPARGRDRPSRARERHRGGGARGLLRSRAGVVNAGTSPVSSGLRCPANPPSR